MPEIVETPERYRKMDEETCREIIRRRKAEMGKDLVILAHHYQRREIVPFGDFLGDSYALSAKAAARKDARTIVFCGVHFMAESADILASPGQTVILPNPYAGCPMADMAPDFQVMRVWEELGQVLDTETVIPVSYMNSTARLKAFCGRNKGLTCTSSNAHRAFAYAYERGERVFFFPDEHLGRNTANRMGIPREAVLLWDVNQPLGGHDREALERARVILWPGHCHVHMNYTVEMIESLRRKVEGVKIIVHPECREEVVAAADASGSTVQIVKYVESLPEGAAVAIGTELNLVARMIDETPKKRVMPLGEEDCPMCVNMYRTTLSDLAYTLDVLKEGGGNVIRVPEDVKIDARKALERMLEIG